MRTRLLRHPLGPGCDAAALFSRLYGARSDVFWLDGGRWRRVVSRHRTRGSPRRSRARRRVARVWREPSSGWSAGSATDCSPRPSGWTPRSVPRIRIRRSSAWIARSPYDRTARGSSSRSGTPGRVSSRAGGRRWSAAVGLPAVGPDPVRPSRPDIRRQDDDESYLAKIGECLEAIREGEAYQICLTTELEVAGSFDPLAVFLALRESSPTHHAALLKIGPISLVSASPEQFLEHHGRRSRQDPSDQGDATEGSRSRRRPRAQRRAAGQREGTRREPDDRRPDAQRPVAGVHARDRSRSPACSTSSPMRTFISW